MTSRIRTSLAPRIRSSGGSEAVSDPRFEVWDPKLHVRIRDLKSHVPTSSIARGLRHMTLDLLSPRGCAIRFGFGPCPFGVSGPSGFAQAAMRLVSANCEVPSCVKHSRCVAAGRHAANAQRATKPPTHYVRRAADPANLVVRQAANTQRAASRRRGGKPPRNSKIDLCFSQFFACLWTPKFKIP